MNTLSPVSAAPPGALVPADPPHVRLVRAFLAGRSPRTLAAYSQDLADFARWCGAADAGEAARLLLACEQGRANEVALAYRQHLQARGLSSATCCRRLAALRSLIRLARTLGMVGWALDVESPRGEPLRDT